MTGITTETRYIYEIGVNQGTDSSWSRGYDGNFTMLEWAQHHADTHGLTYVELVPEHTYMFMRDDFIVEVRWLISKTLMTQDVIDEWAQMEHDTWTRYNQLVDDVQ